MTVETKIKSDAPSVQNLKKNGKIAERLNTIFQQMAEGVVVHYPPQEDKPVPGPIHEAAQSLSHEQAQFLKSLIGKIEPQEAGAVCSAAGCSFDEMYRLEGLQLIALASNEEQKRVFVELTYRGECVYEHFAKLIEAK